jgi:hypothetical protein
LTVQKTPILSIPHNTHIDNKNIEMVLKNNKTIDAMLRFYSI